MGPTDAPPKIEMGLAQTPREYGCATESRPQKKKTQRPNRRQPAAKRRLAYRARGRSRVPGGATAAAGGRRRGWRRRGTRSRTPPAPAPAPSPSPGARRPA